MFSCQTMGEYNCFSIFHHIQYLKTDHYMNYMWILFFIKQLCVLPRNTFPFLRLGMAPPAAPVAFCGKQGEIDQHKRSSPQTQTPFMILVNRCFASPEEEAPDGSRFVRNRCRMFQLPGRVAREGESPRSHHGQI